MDFRLGIGFIVPDTKQTRALIERCRSLLVQIKVRHNMIYSHDRPSTSITPEASNHVNGINGTLSTITFRQREVLAMLARGLSTKQIADQLKISNHTVESHRKSLLEKFMAKNVAELIMKASKAFWFE